jgi:Swt1-like HEPN
METKFSYTKPDDRRFHSALLRYLRHQGQKRLAELLSGGKCVIITSTTYSRNRWDAYRTKVLFYLPFGKFEKTSPKMGQKLIPFCQKIMPEEAGYDVMEIEFSPLLESAETIETSVNEVDVALDKMSNEVKAAILPSDIMKKGKDMAALYVYLYAIENALRLFIEIVALNAYGDEYVKKIITSRSMKDRISQRKANAGKNRWLASRGDSDLFYLDFDDLAPIIQSNWKLFTEFFPSQNWIVSKIEELSACRNLVAHNSYLEEDQRALVKVYYANILIQLNSTLRERVAKV